MTESGMVMGTPTYMAPEQAKGQKEIGPAADVYALGAILYECLTGRPPFLAASVAEILAQVINNDPVAPRQLNAAVPRDLDTIALRCLEKAPSRRFASAGELAADLRRWLSGEPIRARPVGAVERVAKWARRQPVVAGLLTALAALLIAGFAESALYASANCARLEAEEHELTAKRALLKAVEQRDWARRITDVVEGGFDDPMRLDRNLHAFSRDAGSTTPLALVLNRARQKATQQMASNPDQQASVLVTVASSYRSLAYYPEAEECLTLALKHWASRGKARDMDRADALRQLGLLHMQRGQLARDVYTQARASFNEALAIYQRLDALLTLESKLLIASLDAAEERYDEARAGFQAILDYYREKGLPTDRVSCRAEMGLASATYEQDPSLQVFKDELLPMVVGPMRKMLVLDPEKTWSKVLGLFIEAGGLFLQGQIAAHKPPAWRLERQLAGDAKLIECADLIKKEYGEWHLHRYIPLFRLGESMAARGDLDGAEASCREALEVVRRSAGLAHDKEPAMMVSYAGILARQGRLDDAVAEFARVLEAFEARCGGKRHFLYANALVCYGSFLLDVGEARLAVFVFEEAMAIYEATGGPRWKLYKLCQQQLRKARGQP